MGAQMELAAERASTLVRSDGRTSRAPGGVTAERCFDVWLALLLLPFVVVVGAVIALAIYIDSPGPVIYRSPRVGRDGKLFAMLKFRKMRRDAAGDPLTLEDDERFTPIGRFLAATRLDELPQIYNVLRGQMRLVGPRPELECFVRQFADEYAEIVSVTPGVTGRTQLLFADEKRLLAGADPQAAYCERVLPLKIELDLGYVRTRSLRGDLAILAATVALPFLRLVRRVRTSSTGLRLWLPATGSALMLALVFMLASASLN
jgi:lipopolysaccharide/colanic/teichoic acid biosynthesis glycosyltransferase